MQTTFIYALCEPETKTIRYFGKADDPQDRFAQHLRERKNWPVVRWIKKLQKTKQKPDLYVLCEVAQDDFVRFERAFIALGRQSGFRLLNATAGGEGCLNPSLETRAKMSLAAKGKKKAPRSLEHCANLSLAAKARSSEYYANASARLRAMNAARKGKKMPPRSPEHCANISAGKKGKKRSPESCVRISVGKKGKYQKNTSGFLGVVRDKNKWLARIGSKYIGIFSKIEDAVFARNLAIANLL